MLSYWVPNVPKPRLGALLRSLVTPALLACCESLGIGVSGCCMMQTNDAGRLRLQRWRSCWTPARARRYHGEGAVPARPGPGKFAFKKKPCQRRCLLLARAAQGLGGAPHCVRHLTGGKQPIPGLITLVSRSPKWAYPIHVCIYIYIIHVLSRTIIKNYS